MDNLKHLDKEHKHPITTTQATPKDRKEWQTKVMPYEKTSTAKEWDWDKNSLSKNSIPGAYNWSKQLGQNPEYIVLKKDNIPIAMMLQVKDFKAKTTNEPADKQNFVWFIQKAPKEYLLKHNINEKDFDIKIAKAIIDVALTSAVKENKQVLLHADPAGKDMLLEFYKQEGFTQINKDATSKISTTRPNDGRYFIMSKEKTLLIVNKNRETIGQALIKNTIHKRHTQEVTPKMEKEKASTYAQKKEAFKAMKHDKNKLPNIPNIKSNKER